MKKMARTVDAKDDTDKVIVVNTSDLLQFLEYEEALTKDKDTASRIRTLLINLKVWEKNDGTKSK
jgi:predicted class III extradiol MEMO1 family dioxygenase